MIYDELFDWQKQIIDKFEDKKRFGLFLDMGLGKTCVSLAFAERHKCNKILIVSIDKKVRETADIDGSFFWWLNKTGIAYNQYSKDYSFVGKGPKKRQVTLQTNSNDVYLVNYESLYEHGLNKKEKDENGNEIVETKKKKKRCEIKDNVQQFISSCKGQNVCVILDESHKVKELSSLQTQAIQKIMRNLSLCTPNIHLYLLTGTPFTKGYIDLYSQLNLLGWEGNKTLFVDAFCVRGEVPNLKVWEQPIVSYKNVDKLYDLIHKFALTIKSTDVIDLPEQVFTYHVTPMSNELLLYTAEQLKANRIQAELDKRGCDYVLDEAPRDGKVNNPFYRNIAFPSEEWMAEVTSTFYMRARQLSIGFQGNAEYAGWYNKNRLEKLRELLEDNPDNYVLFYNFTPELIEIFNICEELGYNIDVYSGEIKSEIFYNKYAKQTPGERLTNTKNIIIANFTSGSAGGNWQLYNKCILFSVPVFKDYQQGIKRVHRIGQKETVIYHVFYEDNWVDQKMLEALAEGKDYDANLFASDLARVQELLGKY